MGDDGPVLPPTAKLEKSEIMEGLLRRVVDKVDDISIEMRKLRADVEGATNDMATMKRDVSTLMEFKRDTEQRLERGSLRAKGESKTNEEQNAAIATVVTDLAEVKKNLAANTALTQRALAILDQPIVKKLGYAAAAAAIAALSYATAYFQARGH